MKSLVHINRRAAEAANDLGKDLIRQGRRAEAFECFEQAARLDPSFAEAHNNFAIMLNEQRRYDEAVAEYLRAVQLDPAYPEAYFNLGNAFHRKGDLETAIDYYQKAIDHRPHFPKAYDSMAIVLMESGRLDKAIEACKKAISAQPNDPSLHNNFALALRKAGQPDIALQALNTAIALQPNYATGHNNRGLLLSSLGQYEEAVLSLKKALGYQPRNPEFLTNLLRLLRERGRLAEAIDIGKNLTKLIPDYAEALEQLASLLEAGGYIDEAYAHCTEALRLKPDLFDAYNTLGNILRNQGKLDQAIENYRLALALKPEAVSIYSNLVFTLLFTSGYGPAEILEENRKWAASYENPLLPDAVSHSYERREKPRLKIGYVCPYFRMHCAALFLMPTGTHHDPSRFEVFAYSGVKHGDEVTERFKKLDITWRDCADLTDAELASRIHLDGIDILIDIALHMQVSRLLVFARKPAPVQVTWLGYPGTTGLQSMDYRLTDPFIDPPVDGDEFYSEKLFRLPETFWCYAPLEATPDISPLPSLESGHVTFGCFNNFQKVTDETLNLWAAVLKVLPDSRLIMLSQPGSHRARVQQMMQRSGVDPQRITFRARMPTADYLALFNEVDLCLDTTPYPGHTTHWTVFGWAFPLSR